LGSSTRLPTTVTNVSFNAGLLPNMPATAAGFAPEGFRGPAGGRTLDRRSVDDGAACGRPFDGSTWKC